MANIILYDKYTINNETDLPTADEDHRGMIMIEKGGRLEADVVKICVKDALDSYAWKTIAYI